MKVSTSSLYPSVIRGVEKCTRFTRETGQAVHVFYKSGPIRTEQDSVLSPPSHKRWNGVQSGPVVLFVWNRPPASPFVPIGRYLQILSGPVR